MDTDTIVGPGAIMARYGCSRSHFIRVILPAIRDRRIVALGPRCHRWRLADVVAVLEGQ